MRTSLLTAKAPADRSVGALRVRLVMELPTAAAAAVATTATTAAVSAAIIAAATVSAAGLRPFLHRARLIYREGASAEVLPVPHIDRALRFRIGRHFDEAETLRATAHLVHDDDG